MKWPPPVLALPPLSATARTIATITRTITPPAIARALGDACRAPPAPFERTGGGACAACWRCCLARLPLGIGRKGSRVVVGTGGCKDQESDEQEEARQRLRRDCEVSEGHVLRGHGQPVVRTAASVCRAGGELVDRAVLDEHVVDRDAG